MAAIEFAKMQGLDNDFVVIERLGGGALPSAAQVRRMSDRRRGVGFDQLLCLEPGSAGSDFGMSIFNADGSPAEQCGNGVRCLALYVARRGLIERRRFSIVSCGRHVDVELADDGLVRCNMGPPVFEPADIPFDADVLADWYDLELGNEQIRVGAVSMGNPHVVVEVTDVTNAPVATLGAQLERHRRFPKRVNVGFMQVVDRGEIRLRVFERGVGETRACGTGACAAAVVGRRTGLLDDDVEVRLTGGSLQICWAGGDEPVWLTGPAAWVYEGTIEV